MRNAAKKTLVFFLVFTLLLPVMLPLHAAAGPAEEHAHIFVAVPGTRVEPTCVNFGSVQVRCTVCGLEQTDVLNALGHKFIPELDQPNLFGTVRRYCERCEDWFRVKKGEMQEPEPEKDPPAQPAGYEEFPSYAKDRIGAWNTSPDPEQSGLHITGNTDKTGLDHPECFCPVTDEKYGHTHYFSYISGDPTCTQWGWEAYSPCLKCGELHSAAVEKSVEAELADGYLTDAQAAEQREKYAWDFRYTTPPHGHKYDNPSREGYPDPTCTADGLWRVHCDYYDFEGCGECYYEEAEKLGHDYQLQKTEILDEDNWVCGYHATVTCQRCSDTHKPSIYGRILGLKDGEKWDALGCKVIFKNLATGEETAGVNQNEAAGRDYFADLPVGRYSMTVNADEYETRTYTVKIRDGVQLEADVLLNKTGDYDENGFLDIKSADFSFSGGPFYETGEPLTPNVTVTDDGEVLTEGVDYTVEYTDNVSWGYGYAKIKGIGAYKGQCNAPFYIQPKPQEDTSSRSPGDVSGDGHIAAEDARLALRAAVGLENYEEGSPEFLAADADHNGTISAGDARLILRAAVGLENLV